MILSGTMVEKVEKAKTGSKTPKGKGKTKKKKSKEKLAKADIAVSSGVKELTRADISDYLDQNYLQCRVIIEILGGPPEYIEDTLVKFVEKMKRESSVIMLKETFEKPKKQDKLYLTFAELEFLIKDITSLMFFCFDYMPSSVEILEPETFQLRSSDFTGFLNDVQSRLHKIDKMVKEGVAHNKNLLRNTNLLLRNLIIVTLTYKGPTNLSDLARFVGVGDQQLTIFLGEMTKEGWIREEKGKFIAVKKK